MIHRGAARLAWSACGLGFAETGLAVWLAILNGVDARTLFAHHLPGQALDAIAFSTLGAVIAGRRPEHRIGWLLCAAGVGAGLDALASQYGRYGLITQPGALPAAVIATWFAAWGYLPTFAIPIELLLMLFPTGRLPSPRWWPVAWLTVGLLLAATALYAISPVLIGGLPIANPFDVPALKPSEQVLQTISFVLVLSGVLLALSSVVVRFRRSRGMERQQLKWFVYAAVLTFVGVEVGPALLLQNVLTADTMPYVDGVLGAIAFPCLACAMGIAILRYRLYDIDLLINRTLVYAALTACVVGMYILVVGYVGAVFHARGDAVSLIATGLVAVAFQPLRERLQRTINHLLYGQRDEPYAVLARLGQRLESTLAPEGVLLTIVRTVAEALRLPYVAIALGGGASGVVVGTGTPGGQPTRLPLVYQHEVVGELLLCPRTPGEAFDHADRRLLEDLARQVGVAAHAVQLTAELQLSRERLVTTREEERRRLRRDLHDGLGPVLAGLTLQLDAARALVRQDPPAAERLLGELKTQAQTAVGDIRRLVYALRPPALDDLGLVPALRATAAQYEAVDGSPLITLEAPAALPSVPAAVEVAIYRITQEALANVVRHAQARSCEVRLAFDAVAGVVYLAVADDGRGVADDSCPGIGLHSMRERAEELGGIFALEAQPSGGTRVTARLPCKVELR